MMPPKRKSQAAIAANIAEMKPAPMMMKPKPAMKAKPKGKRK